MASLNVPFSFLIISPLFF